MRRLGRDVPGVHAAMRLDPPAYIVMLPGLAQVARERNGAFFQNLLHGPGIGSGLLGDGVGLDARARLVLGGSLLDGSHGGCRCLSI